MCTVVAIPGTGTAQVYSASVELCKLSVATVTNIIAALGKCRCFGTMAGLAICVPRGSALADLTLLEAAPADLVVGFAA
jgi:hypothetical protein